MPNLRRRVLLRADSGPRVGFGHTMRCLALAQELALRGFDPWLASHTLTGTERRVRESGYPVIRVSGPPRQEVETIRARSGDLLAPTDPRPFRFVVLDHYMDTADEWLQEATSLARRRLVIDDAPGRRLSCELVVNPAIGIEPDAYTGLASRRARILLGPRYVPLRRSLRSSLTTPARGREGKVESVLIAFGGGTSPATTLAVDAVREALPQASVDVVVGVGSPTLPQSSGQVRLHVDPDDDALAAILRRAGIAIGAGGVSAYERCLAGLPTIAMELASNQAAMIRGLAGAGAVLDAGKLTALSRPHLVGMIRQLAADPAGRASMSEKGRQLVDGRGAERIAHELEGVRMRAPRPEDIGLLWRWSNDPEVRLQSVSRQTISWARHRRWFAAMMDDPATILFVGHNSAGPVGQVRFEIRGEVAEVSIATDPGHRGTVGSVLLRSALRRFRRNHHTRRLMARVRPDNVASRRMFDSAGFREAGGDAETLRFVLDLPDQRRGGGVG